MKFQGRLTLSPDVLLQEVGDEIVLLDLRNGTYYGLNPVGACILRCIKDGEDLDGAHAKLLNEFDVGPGVLESDMAQLVKELLTRRLLCEIKL